MTVPTPAGPGPAQFNQVWVDKYGPKSAEHVLVLMPGTIAGSGNFTLAARYLVKHVAGPSGLGDRPPLAGAGGHRDVRPDAAGREEPAGDVRLLPRLPGRRHPAHPPHLRQRQLASLRPPVGNAGRAPGRARGRAQGARQGQAQGHPRRALAGRLADHRLRRLGLQRPSRPQGHRRHGRDRRRPAGQLRLARLAGRDAGRDRRPQHRQPLRRPARLRDPRDHRSLRRDRRHLRATWRRTPRRRRCRASRCCPRSSTLRCP